MAFEQQTSWLRHLRLTIAKKLALAIIGIVILCVGTMAWVTSQNLQRGFISYLNQLQAEHLEQVAQALEKYYRENGNFNALRHNRREMRQLLDSVPAKLLSSQFDPNDPREARRTTRRAQRAQLEQQGAAKTRPAERPTYGPAPTPPLPRFEERPGPEGRPGMEGRPGEGRPGMEGRPDERRPGMDGRPGETRPGMEGRDGPPPEVASLPPAPAPLPPDGSGRDGPGRDGPGRDGSGEAGPNQPPPDPMGFAGRLSILDANDHPVIGPPTTPGAIERVLLNHGSKIGTLRLAPIRAVSGNSEGTEALRFIQNQIHTILWLAGVLLVLAILLAAMLARHFLRPVSALREVTQQLAQGQFEARAPVMNQDELSELAHHVNDMAQALQDNEARRRKMLADISHELRTPLSVMRGEIEAIQDGVRKSGPQALNSLHGEVLRLNKLIDDLHQLSMADSGHLQCRREQCDLVPLLSTIGQRYLPRAAQANLGLKLQLPPTGVVIDGDPDRLTQVFTNLLENSLRYTDGGGSIVLSVRTNAKRVQILVEDSAPGVATEALPRLFERLYRTDAARTRTSGGSGLGLSICQALIQAHGGQINALASPLGGVRIQIQLPLHPA
jgi:two-component system sensor histidine kinase BaeS